MKPSKWIALVAALPLAALVACGEDEGVGEFTEQDAFGTEQQPDVATAPPAGDREEAMQEYEQRLSEIRQELDQTAQQGSQQLQQKLDQAQSQLDDMKSAAEEEWNQSAQEVDSLLSEIEQDLQRETTQRG